jgi:ABC-type transport system substrate-binding protein
MIALPLPLMPRALPAAPRLVTWSRKFWRVLWVLALLLGVGRVQAASPPSEKVLRYAFEIAETGFDPAQLSDLYSRIVTSNLFDSLYGYDYLARPAKVRPNVAVGMPDISDDFRTYTIRIRPGIYFADDPVFGGKKRELTAHDFVYSYKRFFDPKTKSPVYSDLEEEKLLGMEELRKEAEKPGARFDYDKEVEGIRALDRYTIRFKLQETRPRFIYQLADGGLFGAVAREVVEHYGDKIMEHPVGTGPFKLDQWTRSSKMSFVKNPNFREEFYEAQPPADDALSQAIYQQMKGKRLPMVDRVEISVIEEIQPRWLSFLGNEHDLLYLLPEAFAYQAIPNARLAPNLAKRHISMERVPVADVTATYFNMDNAVVGGYAVEKVALRRAIALAYNTEEEIRLPRRNQAIHAQGPIQPTTYGYDPQFKTEMSAFDRARASALLDMYGYVDRDGDGWRDLPDGKPLVLEYATSPDAASRERNEIWKKSMDAAGIRIEFKAAKWPENLKAARAGKLMMWGLGWSAANPDGDGALGLAYGPAKGENNLSRFENAEYDRLYRKQKLMPDGPERLAIMQQIVKIVVAYMPYKFATHRIRADLMQPWLLGYRRHPVARGFWKYVDIDLGKAPK